GRGEDAAHESGRAGFDVAVGADETFGDRADAADDARGAWVQPALPLVSQVMRELPQSRVHRDHLRPPNLSVASLRVGAFARRDSVQVLTHAPILCSGSLGTDTAS